MRSELPALYVLDTSAFSDLMGDEPASVARLAGMPDEARVVTCPIVRGEIRFGIERLATGRRRQHLESAAAKVSRQVPCEPMPEPAGDEYARAKFACQRKGEPLDENDLWIAATALALGAVLVTRDEHFERIDGLTVEDWTQ